MSRSAVEQSVFQPYLQCAYKACEEAVQRVSPDTVKVMLMGGVLEYPYIRKIIKQHLIETCGLKDSDIEYFK